MKPILSLYWRLCRLGAGPEEVPFSRELLALTLVAWLMLQMLVAPFQPDFSWVGGVAAGLLGLAVLFAVTLALLAFKGLLNRWLQSLAALVGVDLVLGLFSFPMLVLHHLTPGVREQAWFQIPVFLLLCWQLLAQGHVFHRALNVGPVLGTLVAIMVLLLTYAAVAMVFPGPMGGSG